ncbi:MAG: hypothetical protein HYX32_05690 [Actinobacteria bacterium]|nr:hypothetical protein [Actinomycetota bacterium]
MAERYVVAGVAPARSVWFQQVAKWSTAAVLPLDFVKCMSVEEARARLGSGRAFSVLLADAGVSGLDRDLIDQARTAGAAVFIVDDGRTARDWVGLGASAVLPDEFDSATLLGALSDHATMLGGTEPHIVDLAPTGNVAWRGRLVAVTGPGGTGASTVAMALATGMGSDVRNRGLVALADFKLNADQALLHDARDIVPGIQELVEAHRAGTPSTEQVRGFTFGGLQPYHLLLGLRRQRDWSVLRPRSFLASLDSLRRTFTAVVCDIEADFEGEDACGSIEVEERNLMARSVADHADVIAVVGLPGVKGLHSLARVTHALLDHGVRPERIVPVMNRAPRQARGRAELARALVDLLDPTAGATTAGTVEPMVFVPERKRLDLVVRDAAAMPSTVVDAITSGINAVIDRLVDTPHIGAGSLPEPGRIVPGSLGSWGEHDQEATGT